MLRKLQCRRVHVRCPRSTNYSFMSGSNLPWDHQLLAWNLHNLPLCGNQNEIQICYFVKNFTLAEVKTLPEMYMGNATEEYARFFELGVDGVFTDFPSHARHARHVLTELGACLDYCFVHVWFDMDFQVRNTTRHDGSWHKSIRASWMMCIHTCCTKSAWMLPSRNGGERR